MTQDRDSSNVGTSEYCFCQFNAGGQLLIPTGTSSGPCVGSDTYLTSSTCEGQDDILFGNGSFNGEEDPIDWEFWLTAEALEE